MKDSDRNWIKNNKRICWAVVYAVLLGIVMCYGTFAASYPSYNSETDCRSCHGITGDRHHLMVPNGMYQCTDCHAMKYDTQNQTYYPQVIRNCLSCHPGKNHTDSHHLLVAQGLFVCSDCHAMKYDNQSQTYYPEIIWDCTVCHSTVLSPGSTVPVPPPIPSNPPTITSFSPPSPTNDIAGASREFNITLDQEVNLIWYINDNLVQSNDSITIASYTNTSAAQGVWNVSAKASNVNGNIMYTWTWNVTSAPPPPVITSSAPISPVNDTIGSSRKFVITIDQTANIVWYINGNPVQSNDSVMGASYNNTSATEGVWDVSAIATNANGSVGKSWTWNVANHIRYNFDGFLSPIRKDGSSIFKLGKTVPIKFQLLDSNGNYVTNAVAILDFSQVTKTVTGKHLAPYTSGDITIGNVFIYDSKGHMYMYNLATKGLSAGTWRIRIEIDDGSSYAVNISLK